MACKDCATGVLHEGTPAGKEDTIHGLPTYVTEPPDGTAPKGVVVVIPDAFGWKLNNNRILADQYAKRIGVIVYLPDFMNGRVLDPGVLQRMDTVAYGTDSMFSKLLPGLFVARHLIPFLFFNRPTAAQPRVFAFFNSLRTSTSLPIGAAGFCWGGKHTFLLRNSDIAKTPDGKPLIDVAYSAHPSSLVLPKEAEEVKVPLCVSNGSMDMMLKADGVEMIKEAFKKKEGSEEGKYEMNVVDGAKHGFAVRGNPGDEEEKRKGQLAEDQAVDFFGKWLVQSQ